MNQLQKITATVIMFSCLALPLQADQTNLVQRVSIRLLGARQGATVTNRNMVVTSVDTGRVGTDRVISALGLATGNTFSQDAKLVAITPLAQGFSKIEVRDGTSSVEVTGFFSHEQIGDSLHTGLANTRTGRSTRNDYNLQQFALHDADAYPALNLHFDVRGLAVDTLVDNGNSVPRSETRVEVSGTGDDEGTFLLLMGSIILHVGTLEVVPDGPPPGV